MASIFHITTAPAWEAARAVGRYAPSSLETEGFIHFSSEEQVTPVANAAFRGTPDLVLLRVATDSFFACGFKVLTTNRLLFVASRNSGSYRSR